MIHPDTELCWISAAIGRGVRATRRIPKGTLSWVRCGLDRVLTHADVEALAACYRPFIDRYAYVDHLGRRILCWDAGRHVNHHCDANSRALGLDAQIATRDIEVGEQLTCDYGECNLVEPLCCQCGAANCRGTIRPSDLRIFADQWDAEVAAAIRSSVGVAQPLLQFTVDPVTTAAILQGVAQAPSIVCVGVNGKPANPG